jgi:hypothetical protein
MNGGDQFLIISHLTLRWLVGTLGVLLPVIVAVLGFIQCECLVLQPTISHYYDLDSWPRNLFVGILFAIATFFWAYRGYENRDLVCARLCSAFALGVALFPHSGGALARTVHFASAVLLFVLLACFALFLFTKSDGLPTPEKRIRNRIYTVCGLAILVCVALIALISTFGMGAALAALKPIFWLESIALWAFGITWFIKGETLWRDRITEPARAIAS